ncbi:metal-dependent hydrolase [Changchengzhania lutea]|uniref:metal-dependent hydrolase n=1 Tax=Changchengzhania lutea TaxID=2049305 RepID=UPI00115D7C95|nr:metal-dependent hydrolase [Changchengzhania lutea]
MDSLTQIVLGAACGEAVLGKKIGNKALLFGAIGGTIPDLDVFVGNLLYNNNIDEMLFHRGFMHSILFSVLGAFLFGWLFYKLYDTKSRKHTTQLKDWIILFFLALFTHIILDCFTPYGTQLFTPFNDYRVACDNIAVADPLYTLPFLICMLVLMFYKRHSKKRLLWLKLGVGISSVYMLFTVVNKMYMDSVFETSFHFANIPYSRFRAQPTILNNVLWYGIAETKDDYYVGYYSLFDKASLTSDFKKIPKNRLPLVSEDLDALSWFSDGYYNIYEMENDTYHYNDLRYPLLKQENPKSFVFSLILYKDENRLNMKPFEPEADDFKTSISNLWERLKGI